MSWMKGHEPDFSKRLGQKIRFANKTYLGESSESDIRPSLYNQALSTILQASQNSWIFLIKKIRISDFSGSGQYLEGKT